MLTDNSSRFCSSLKFLHFWLVKWWWWNESLNNIYVSTTIFVIGRFIVGIDFSFEVSYLTLNSLLVILSNCQKRKKAQQTCQSSRWHREFLSVNRFSRVYWIVKFFPSFAYRVLQKSLSFDRYFIYYLRRFILTNEIIHTTKSTIKHCRFEKYWIKPKIYKKLSLLYLFYPTS